MSRIANTRPIDAKVEPYRDRAYLNYVRTLPCIISGHTGKSDPAHIGTLGRGVKSHDYHTLPLSNAMHIHAHQTGEISFFREHLSDSDLRRALQALGREMYEEWKA